MFREFQKEIMYETDAHKYPLLSDLGAKVP